MRLKMDKTFNMDSFYVIWLRASTSPITSMKVTKMVAERSGNAFAPTVIPPWWIFTSNIVLMQYLHWLHFSDTEATSAFVLCSALVYWLVAVFISLETRCAWTGFPPLSEAESGFLLHSRSDPFPIRTHQNSSAVFNDLHGPLSLHQTLSSIRIVNELSNVSSAIFLHMCSNASLLLVLATPFQARTCL